MKTLTALALAAAAFAAYAGEDSTHRSGPGGTGPEFYAAPSLKGFAGPGESRPGQVVGEKELSNEEIRAWMVQHMKVMDETMIRMRDEHRSLMGGGRR